MDPDKSASAPPLSYPDEKSSAGQLPPPAYNDNLYPGHTQPGPWCPPQAQQPYPPQYGGEQHHYQAQPGTIMVQPTMYVAQGPLANPVKDYMCYSIFTMICCCLPLGVAALIYSISAREANHIGDQLAAERSSRTSKTLNHVALGLGIGGVILMIVYFVVMVSVM